MNHSPNQHWSARWRNFAACGIGLFAGTAMLGDLLQVPPLKAIGLVSAIAPCPKVFCDAKGLEAFASEFFLRFETNGVTTQLKLTPELYSKLQGPYNRGNVYGAALSFAPRLPEPLWRAVLDYALSPQGPMRVELGLPSNATNMSVLIHTRTRGRADVWELHQP
jgi:hypothetical protein